MMNKEDARDGILSIKEWMRTMREDDGETRKFEPMPLMKQVWNGQQFAWKYCGKTHETAEALGAWCGASVKPAFHRRPDGGNHL